MKNAPLMLVITCLFSLNVFSQMDYNRGNTMSNPSQNYEPSKEEIEKTREENLNKLMTKLTEDLNLDALQVIAIRQIYADNIKKQGIILKKEDSNESKSEALNSLAISTETRVLALLNPQQKEKFEQLKNQPIDLKDKKKERKKKK